MTSNASIGDSIWSLFTSSRSVGFCQGLDASGVKSSLTFAVPIDNSPNDNDPSMPPPVTTIDHSPGGNAKSYSPVGPVVADSGLALALMAVIVAPTTGSVTSQISNVVNRCQQPLPVKNTCPVRVPKSWPPMPAL
ncbi:MAG: hypothetical protein R3C99_21240 [Pirellulaceae bacterium]